ncbi:MAG: TolC family protein [Pseudodesulfovibrio sp.]|nr:TolC family protein [Pseudodesulfovibrio sp.]
MREKILLEPFARVFIRGVLACLLLSVLFVGTGWTTGFSVEGKNTETLRMSMGDVVGLTLRNNLNVRTSYLSRVLEKFEIEQAEAKFEPTVNIDGTVNLEAVEKNKRMYGHSKKAPSSKLDAGVKASVVQKIPTGADLSFVWDNTHTDTSDGSLSYDGSAGVINRTKSNSGGFKSSWRVEFSQPLLKGSGLDYNMASIKLARIQEQRNILSLRDTLSALINEGVNLFFTFVQARENLEIQLQGLERSKRLLETNRLKMKLGRMSRSDVTQAEADVASQEYSLEQTINSLDDARRNLLNHLELDQNVNIEPVKQKYPKIKPVLDVCLNIALKNNQSYLDKVFAVTEANTNYMIAENDRMWELAVTGGYGEAYTDANPGYSYKDTELRGGIELKAPINLWGGDYLDRKKALLQAATNKRRAMIELEKAKRNIQNLVTNTVRNVTMGLKSIKLAKRNTELQAEQLKNENAKLMAGRSTNFQVVTYQDQLTQAQQDEVASSISYLQALLELDQTLGTTMDTWKVEFKHDDTKLEKDLNDEVRPLTWTWW